MSIASERFLAPPFKQIEASSTSISTNKFFPEKTPKRNVLTGKMREFPFRLFKLVLTEIYFHFKQHRLRNPQVSKIHMLLPNVYLIKFLHR